MYHRYRNYQHNVGAGMEKRGLKYWGRVFFHIVALLMLFYGLFVGLSILSIMFS